MEKIHWRNIVNVMTAIAIGVVEGCVILWCFHLLTPQKKNFKRLQKDPLYYLFKCQILEHKRFLAMSKSGYDLISPSPNTSLDKFAKKSTNMRKYLVKANYSSEAIQALLNIEDN